MPTGEPETYLCKNANEIFLCRVKPTSVPRQPNCSSDARQPEVLYGERGERLGSALLRRRGGE
jgi:hypothetical protein